MNIESREVYLGFNKEEREHKIWEREQFGWQYTQDVRRGKATYSVFVRDKDMPHYYEIVELDDKYFELVKKKKYIKPVVEDFGDVLILICLFILFVIPFILFLIWRITRRNRAIKFNENLQVQMDEVIKKAQELIKDNK